MNFDLSDEQKMLKDTARRMLEDRVPTERLRSLIADGEQWDPELWQSLAELGLLAASVPEDFGGLGLGEIDLSVIAEEMGRVVAPVPFFSSICLAAEAIRLAGNQLQKEKWLPLLASGEAVGTFALDEGAGGENKDCIKAKFEAGLLNGMKMPVADAAIAQVCVVFARIEAGFGLFLVELEQDGVRQTPLAGFDQLRHHARIEFSNANAELLTVDEETIEMLRLKAGVFSAFEQIGGAEACLYMARDYTLERQIFGRSVASYQAVKHKLADLFVEIELARSNAYYAAWALENMTQDMVAASAAAKISAIRAYEQAARENLQLHGGIGYTIEADCHFHYRRARLLALNVGSDEAWITKLVASLSDKLSANQLV